MPFNILTINPGSTSTKIGLYQDISNVFTQIIDHSAQEIAQFPTITDQFAFRLEQIRNFLANQNLHAKDLSAVVARGGLLKPMAGGTYQINQAMLDDLRHNRYGAHACNLGAIIADLLAKEGGCPAYIVDPAVVDELAPVARLTGCPGITRKSIFHALNQKAVAKRFAKSINRSYDSLNLIIAHLGGGISIACHTFGQAIDVNNAFDGEGPFSPERAGTLPAKQFAEKIINEKLDLTTISSMIAGKGGLVAHLGTNDVREVERRITAGDKQVELVYHAMIYSIAKSIAAAAVPVCGNVDYIIITGGIAYSDQLTSKLKEYIGFIAPVIVMPGEDELRALAEGAYRVLIGEENAKLY
ncbi:butyrate kinase [Sporomusa acidovorans]|uniref:Probable butyrate kinase n=1 Tax=Sporomusa acidovorans (strain ATCC 49682 / DSM 3132 / Mol) TaxID=1123286 RepID=A0ABZ3IVF4_SPOA4|nr:butyrate kinase [Sporomusa acidovorans]OZC22632.1 butyrate kinase 2 [Sporomusa acidovorans DSM 3132]SDE76404.1 butyrate kinase [Sporomusa acidovorans]